MKLEFDCLSNYLESQKQMSNTTSHNEPSKTDMDRFKLTMKLAQAKMSQYEHIKNESKWNALVNKYYPFLCEHAKYQDARVELDIDEETMLGTLYYTSPSDIILQNDYGETNSICKIIAAASNVIIYKEENFLKVQFIFGLYDKKQICDNSDQIAAIEKEIAEFKKIHGAYYEIDDES